MASAGWWLNARAYTAILYLNNSWRPEHGGCLRLYKEPDTYATHATTSSTEQHATSNSTTTTTSRSSPSSPFFDVEPIAGRLVVFSSQRMMHEVLPVTAAGAEASRWALTLWMLDPDLPLEKERLGATRGVG